MKFLILYLLSWLTFSYFLLEVDVEVSVEGIQGYKACEPLGRYTMLFQFWALESLRHSPRGVRICILSDRQASLKVLTPYHIVSKLVWGRLQNLTLMVKHNKVNLVGCQGTGV